MKHLPSLILLIFIYSCNSIDKETYLTNTCDCLKKVEVTSKELKEDIADCLQSNFVAYRKGANYAVQKFMDEHPSATKEEAQNQVVENLHVELLEKCPKYKELNDKLTEKN
ncbi:hypothetical protein MWU59_09725 [Flavobacteriaceae bacterium F08102]|nr:hypothetical protein [Flavobacteriaceae bacterium F08102]